MYIVSVMIDFDSNKFFSGLDAEISRLSRISDACDGDDEKINGTLYAYNSVQCFGLNRDYQVSSCEVAEFLLGKASQEYTFDLRKNLDYIRARDAAFLELREMLK